MSDEIPPLLTHAVARAVIMVWAREQRLHHLDLEPRKDSDQYLYFARSQAGNVKVGWSRNPSSRVSQYSDRGERFSLVIVCSGFAFGDEQELQRSAKGLRANRRAEVYPPGPVSELVQRLVSAAKPRATVVAA